MREGKTRVDWLYLFRMEDSTMAGNLWPGTFKTLFWVGMSILIGIGLGQLG